jgi:anti-sigma regulatory factor (Ser/Thr protein kinase)
VDIDISVQLANRPASLPEARAALSPLEAAVDAPTFETLRLLVTELVANSVRHSTQPRSEDIELAVQASCERIRVEVSDAGWGFIPLPRDEEADEASGWGLHLVERLSDRRGTELNDRITPATLLSVA